MPILPDTILTHPVTRLRGDPRSCTRFYDENTGECAVDSDASLVRNAVAHDVAELGHELLTREGFMPGILTPVFVLRVNIVA